MATDRALLAALINSSGEEAAIGLLVASGRDRDAAEKEVKACLNEVVEQKLKAEYATFKNDLSVQAGVFLENFVDDDNLPDTIKEVEIILAYTPEKIEIAKGQFIEPGGYVSRFRIKTVDGDDKWKTISSIGRSSGTSRGSGGGRNVLTPKDAPFRFWRVHAEAAYTVVDSKPDYDAGELKVGTGYSATDQLTKVGDCVYLYCKKVKEDEARQTTWEEVLAECPDAEGIDYPASE